MYCRIRSYILTCRRHDIEPLKALEILFSGSFPSFIDLNEIDDYSNCDTPQYLPSSEEEEAIQEEEDENEAA
jgi:hypothetical protein